MSKYNNLPKNSIVTKSSALAIQGYISFSPAKVQLEMKQGTNISKTSYSKFKISTQKEGVLNLGTIIVEGVKVYGPERLFIQLEKCKLENTMFNEALKKLEGDVNPFKVSKLYSQLKNVRRGINKERIENFLQDNLLDLENLLSPLKKDEKTDFLREYVIYLCSKMNIPFLLKGGSAIELFSKVKRSTSDIDAHSGANDNKKILKLLEDNKNYIYFKITEEDRKTIFSKKLIKKIELIPYSRKKKIQELLVDLSIPISFNNAYSSKEIQDIIKDFQLKKRPLKLIKKTSCISFSQEMLLAEKFQSIISKPEDTTRTKDLIDLYLLNGEFDKKLFKKWIFKKWFMQRKPLKKEEALSLIMENQNKPLTKIEKNFSDASMMYDLSITFEECLQIYKNLIKVVLS